jgi:DNA-binding MarR family transcriptional regulator
MSPDDHVNVVSASPFWWAVEQARARDLTQAEFVVLIVLAHGEGRAGQWACSQSIADIALCGRMSDRKVSAALRRLEAEGLVITDRRQRQTSLYRIIRNPNPPFRWSWEIEGATP